MTDTQVHFTTSITLHSSAILEMIEKKAAAKQPFFEEAVTVCLDAAEKMDEARWMIGDMALLVTSEKHYGEDMIGQFAKRINAPVDRVQEYRTMAAFWEKSARADYLGIMAVITYSHMREAKRLKDRATATAFLYTIADNAWTVEQTRLEVKKLLGEGDDTPAKKDTEEKPEPILVAETYVTEITGTMLTLNVTSARGLKTGHLYRIEIYDIAVGED